MDYEDLCSNSDQSRPSSALDLHSEDRVFEINGGASTSSIDKNARKRTANDDLCVQRLDTVLSRISSGYFSDEHSSDDDNDAFEKNKKKRKGGATKKALAQEKRENAARLKNANKLAIEKEKATKKLLKASSKALQPGECLKHMTVGIGSELISKPYFAKITEVLHGSNVKFSTKPDNFENNFISWKRDTMECFTNGYDVIGAKKITVTEPFLLAIYDIEEMEKLLKEKTLNSQMKFVRETNSSSVTIILYGSAKYFSKKGSKGGAKKNKNDTQKITEVDLEYYLTELSFKEKVSCVKAETPDEIAQIIFQFTKSVAEIPFKQAKKSIDEKANFYMRGENKGCIQTNKEGHGLLQLWSKTLTKFPNASLETAHAICAKFPSPASFVKFLESNDSKTAQKIIANINVRRTADPTGGTRRVGPQLANKLYTFFTSPTGDIMLS